MLPLLRHRQKSRAISDQHSRRRHTCKWRDVILFQFENNVRNLTKFWCERSLRKLWSIICIIAVCEHLQQHHARICMCVNCRAVCDYVSMFRVHLKHRRLDGLLNHLFRRRSRKTSSGASLAFLMGIDRWPVNSPHKGPVTQKMFPFDDVIIRISQDGGTCFSLLSDNLGTKMSKSNVTLLLWQHILIWKI